MSRFDTHINTRIVFGDTSIDSLNSVVNSYGNNVLLVYGKNSAKLNGAYYDVVKALNSKNIYELSGISPNPSIDDVTKGVLLCKEKNIQFIVAIGGGSVIDCAKVISCATFWDGNNFWEFVRKNIQVNESLPIIAVLTIPGSGSETNFEAVISNYSTNEKLVYSNTIITPKVSIIEPRYFYSLSQYQLSVAIADTLSHIIEAFFAKKSMAVNDYLLGGLLKSLIIISDKIACGEKDCDTICELIWCSNMADNGILCCGNDGISYPIHAIEHELSALNSKLVHGEGIAVLLPAWLRYVGINGNPDKFIMLGEIVFGLSSKDKNTNINTVFEQIEKLVSKLQLKTTLSDLSINEESFPIIADRVLINNNLSFGYKNLSMQEIIDILNMCK